MSGEAPEKSEGPVAMWLSAAVEKTSLMASVRNLGDPAILASGQLGTGAKEDLGSINHQLNKIPSPCVNLTSHRTGWTLLNSPYLCPARAQEGI